jgi:hypothetical protein
MKRFIAALLFIAVGMFLFWGAFGPAKMQIFADFGPGIGVSLTLGVVVAMIIIRLFDERRPPRFRASRKEVLYGIVVGILLAGISLCSFHMAAILRPTVIELAKVAVEKPVSYETHYTSFGERYTLMDYRGAVDKVLRKRDIVLVRHRYKMLGGWKVEADKTTGNFCFYIFWPL